MGAPFILLAARRRRGVGGASPQPPVNTVAPDLVADAFAMSLLYSPGTWSGSPPISITARLFVDGVDVAAAAPSMPIDPAWRGKAAFVRETAIGPTPGPVIADSAALTVPAALPPEDAIVALFATKRLGYVIDPQDRSLMLRAGNLPVNANGQGLVRINPGLVSSATAINWTQSTTAAQPVWSDNSILPDGVDDLLLFPSSGTAVQPDFGNLAGFVASVLVTPGPLQLQTIWTVGFGGTDTNNRLTIQGLVNGAAQFTVNDGVARQVFATPAGVLVPGTPVLLTLFVDFQTREAKGFVNGVEQASFTLLNVTDIVNVDSNRNYLFKNHGNASEFSNCRLHRAAFLHDRTNAAGRIVMENWVMQPPVPLDQQVQDILAGTEGFAFDPQDLSTLFQDSAKTIPVTAVGQPVGAIGGKWGAAPETWLQTTAGARPTLSETGVLQYDGVDDFLQDIPNRTFAGASGMFLCAKLMVPDLSVDRTILHINQSGGTAGSFRFGVRVTPTGVLTLFSARVSTLTTTSTAAGAIVAGGVNLVSLLSDLAAEGRSRIWKDGALVADVATADAGGLTPDADASVARIMRFNTASFPGIGKLGRMIFCPFTPTDQQRAVLEAWVSVGPFDPMPVPAPAPAWHMPEDFSTLPPDGGVIAHNGQDWRNISLTPNLWEPGIFGWEAVE